MRRLYVHLYLAFLGIALFTLIVSGVTAALLWDRPGLSPHQAIVVAGAVAAAHHSGPEGDAALHRTLAESAAELDADLVIWESTGQVVAQSGDLHMPFGEAGWFHDPKVTGLRLTLPDGRMLGAGHRHDDGRRLKFLAWLAALAAAMAVGLYPIARRITRRLETVQRGMHAWGDGDLSARVQVSGHDEVAGVARSFNSAAERVEQLFDAQRRVLASASHELRSPLARLRMTVELLADGVVQDEGWAEGAIRDIEELDATVGDLLQVGRMQALEGPEDPQDVDLLALLVEEGAHVDAQVSGPATVVQGDLRLLRRLARNLFENAATHGAPPIQAVVGTHGFEIRDHGHGVPDDVRERIFEPFYRPQGHAEGRDGGVGLGLHLVREIARHHGGEVVCLARDEGGTIFRVSLGTRTPGS